MKILNLVAGIFFFVVSAQAAPQYKGLDILGLAMQDVGMIAKTIEPGTAIGVLEGTFGGAVPALDRLLATGKVPAWRAHLINGTCRRNRNCEKSEPKPNDLRTLEARARQYSGLSEKYSGVPCFLSPVLEHDEKDPLLVRRWVEALRRAAPRCQVVISRFKGVTVPDVLSEGHGNQGTGDIVSNDGESLFDSDSSNYQNRAKIMTLGWINRFNLRVTGEKTFTPPSKRKNKVAQIDIIHAQRLMKPESGKPEGRPPQCRAVRGLQKAELWKTNAEDYANGDVRGNRPLLISQKKNSQLDIYNRIGKKVGCAKYYGPYQNGYHRLYVGSCSRDSGVSLMDKAGSEWVYVNDRGNCLLVNAIRRTGYFR